MKSEIINKPYRIYLCGFGVYQKANFYLALSVHDIIKTFIKTQVPAWSEKNPDDLIIKPFDRPKIRTLTNYAKEVYYDQNWEWWYYAWPESPKTQNIVRVRLADEI